MCVCGLAYHSYQLKFVQKADETFPLPLIMQNGCCNLAVQFFWEKGVQQYYAYKLLTILGMKGGVRVNLRM